MGAALETRAAVPVADAAAVLAAADRVVCDLRSPAEFAVDHVPGAANVPLFDDVERAVIGTLYARRSPEAAFADARERTIARIESLAAEIAALAGWEAPAADLRAEVARRTEGGLARLEGELRPRRVASLPARPVVLACWRGGMRSRSVARLLRDLGLERTVVLEGGYKAYRARVRAALDAWEAPPAYVLRGLTGVGKTLVLRELERLRPGWTLDLEALAGHRSSILGMVGLEPVSQKRFESRLAERLARGFPGLVVFEGESRKIGDAVLPPRVWEALAGGTCIELVAPPERRADVLLDDYLARPGSREELARRLPFLEERLGRRRFGGELVRMLAGGEERALVHLLLERYYDPLYVRSGKRFPPVHRVDATDPRRAAAAVARWIEARRTA